jgi:hypothetical protein
VVEMSELATDLRERGFEDVDAGLPGGWATDGTWTVCIHSRQRGGGMGARSTLQHEVVVYECAPGEIDITSKPAGRAVDTAHSAALRAALQEAGYDAE